MHEPLSFQAIARFAKAAYVRATGMPGMGGGARGGEGAAGAGAAGAAVGAPPQTPSLLPRAAAAALR